MIASPHRNTRSAAYNQKMDALQCNPWYFRRAKLKASISRHAKTHHLARSIHFDRRRIPTHLSRCRFCTPACTHFSTISCKGAGSLGLSTPSRNRTLQKSAASPTFLWISWKYICTTVEGACERASAIWTKQLFCLGSGSWDKTNTGHYITKLN